MNAIAPQPRTATQPRTRAEWAAHYIADGYAVIPMPARTKNPAVNGEGWQQRTYTPEDFAGDANIGLFVGARSGGLVDVDLDAPEAVKAGESLLPPTGMIHGRKGKPTSHYWYHVTTNLPPTRRAFEDVDGPKATLVELRSSNGEKAFQTVVPPSVHESGEPVEWERQGYPAEIDGAELFGIVRQIAVVSLLARHWPGEGLRHKCSLALAGYLLKNGIDEEVVAEIVELAAEIAGDEEAESRRADVATTARKIEDDEQVSGGGILAGIIGKPAMDKLNEFFGIRSQRTAAATGRAVPNAGAAMLPSAAGAAMSPELEFSDIGNAQRLARMYGDKLRYVPQWGWMAYDGKRWQRDGDGPAMEFAKECARSLIVEAAQPGIAPQRYEQLLNHAKRSGDVHRLEAMLKLAQSEPSLAARVEDFDAHPYLLNVANGTVDVRTSERRDHNPSDLITKLAPTDYHPDAEERDRVYGGFLGGVFDDREVADFVRRGFGYSATGVTNKPAAFFIPWGSGRNGKSTLFNAVTRVLGDYAAHTAVETFLRKSFTSSNTSDQARLPGARLVVTSELEAGQTLNLSLVKQVSGGDQITAAHKYKDPFTFTPQCKVWMATNNKPEIPEDSPAVWERIKLIPFKADFTGAKADPKMEEKLATKEVREAILAWVIRGAKEWYEGGLQEPEAVKAATKEYRAEQDELGDFIAEACVEGERCQVKASDLQTAYQNWCSLNGVRPLDEKGFSARMLQRGYTKDRTNRGKVYRGIGVRSNVEEEVAPGSMF